MKTEEDWFDEINDSKEEFSPVSKQMIGRIQCDAPAHAAGIIETYCEANPEYWTKAYNDVKAEIRQIEEASNDQAHRPGRE